MDQVLEVHVREVAVPFSGAVNCAHAAAAGEWKDHGGVGTGAGRGGVSHAYGTHRDLCYLFM